MGTGKARWAEQGHRKTQSEGREGMGTGKAKWAE